jgi:hypothetical protein
LHCCDDNLVGDVCDIKQSEKDLAIELMFRRKRVEVDQAPEEAQQREWQLRISHLKPKARFKIREQESVVEDEIRCMFCQQRECEDQQRVKKPKPRVSHNVRDCSEQFAATIGGEAAAVLEQPPGSFCSLASH